MRQGSEHDVARLADAFYINRTWFVESALLRYEELLNEIAGLLSRSVGGGMILMRSYSNSARAVDGFRAAFARGMSLSCGSMIPGVADAATAALSRFVQPDELPRKRRGDLLDDELVGAVKAYFDGHYGTLSSRIKKPILLAMLAKQDAGALAVAMNNGMARNRLSARELLRVVHSHIWNGLSVRMLLDSLYLVGLYESRQEPAGPQSARIRAGSLRLPGELFPLPDGEGYLHPPGAFSDRDVIVPWNLEWGTP